MSGEIKVQALMYCEAVRTGSKPAAMMSVQSRYVRAMKILADAEGVKIHIEDVFGSSEWKVAWFYKYEYLLEVIEVASSHPNNIFEHWVLGKLFGYSDQAIEEFLTKSLYK